MAAQTGFAGRTQRDGETRGERFTAALIIRFERLSCLGVDPERATGRAWGMVDRVALSANVCAAAAADPVGRATDPIVGVTIEVMLAADNGGLSPRGEETDQCS